MVFHYSLAGYHITACLWSLQASLFPAEAVSNIPLPPFREPLTPLKPLMKRRGKSTSLESCLHTHVYTLNVKQTLFTDVLPPRSFPFSRSVREQKHKTLAISHHLASKTSHSSSHTQIPRSSYHPPTTIALEHWELKNARSLPFRAAKPIPTLLTPALVWTQGPFADACFPGYFCLHLAELCHHHQRQLPHHDPCFACLTCSYLLHFWSFLSTSRRYLITRTCPRLCHSPTAS